MNDSFDERWFSFGPTDVARWPDTSMSLIGLFSVICLLGYGVLCESNSLKTFSVLACYDSSLNSSPKTVLRIED